LATTELIATGTTAVSSSDITVVAGTPVTVFLKKGTDGAVDVNARAIIEQKSAGGTYHEVGALTGQLQARVIDGPGTFRVSRPVSSVAFGVDQS
jgi:hypothetical protein